MMQVFLERVDRASNCYRFFSISVEPNLFDDVSLVVRWGRIGTRGNLRIRASGAESGISDMAADIVRAKVARGYRPTAVGRGRSWAVSARRAQVDADRLLSDVISRKMTAAQE